MNEGELSKNIAKIQSCRMATQEKFDLTFQPSLEMSKNPLKKMLKKARISGGFES